MRTYDPADRIVYVHLAQDPDGCDRLPAGYANASCRTRLPGARPALVLLPGGTADSPPPATALRLAR